MLTMSQSGCTGDVIQSIICNEMPPVLPDKNRSSSSSLSKLLKGSSTGPSPDGILGLVRGRVAAVTGTVAVPAGAQIAPRWVREVRDVGALQSLVGGCLAATIPRSRVSSAAEER